MHKPYSRIGMQEKDNSDSEDDSMIIDTRTDEKKEADRLKKLAAKKAPQILNLINNIAAPQKGGNAPKKQEESQFRKDARINGLPLFEGEIYSDADNYEAPDEDNIAVAPKKTRKKKSSSKNKIPMPIKKTGVDLSRIDDLSKADKDMKKAEGRGFAATELDPRKKTGRGSRALTRLARFFGKTSAKRSTLPSCLFPPSIFSGVGSPHWAAKATFRKKGPMTRSPAGTAGNFNKTRKATPTSWRTSARSRPSGHR